MKQGFGANLFRRVATAALVLPALFAALFLGPPVLIVAIVAATLLVGMGEYHALVAAAGLRPLRAAGYVAVAAAFVEAAAPRAYGAPIWPAAILLLAAAAVSRLREPAPAVAGAAATLLGAAYLGGLGGTLAGLRLLDPASDGPWRVTLLLAIVMGSDTAAFFVGSALGRRPLAPAISPGKTVEGALGGLAGGALGALAVRTLGLPNLRLDHALALGMLVAALGMVGDLFESQLKRWAGVKDSGSLFPGHGGMLDRLDSLLFGGPALYYYFVYHR